MLIQVATCILLQICECLIFFAKVPATAVKNCATKAKQDEQQ